jgi:hypothetical protein
MSAVILICVLSLAMSACCTDTDTIRQIRDQAAAAKSRVGDCVADSSALSASGGPDAAKAKDIHLACVSVQQALESIANASGKLAQGR